jgi:NADPH:quinone reductase-like Zn-dependent oxidoreductase
VQFARAAEAHVIASVLQRDKDEALRLGADEVISIPSEDTRGLRGTLDTVIDTVGGEAQKDLFALVRKGGTLISSVSAPDTQLAQQFGSEAKFILVDVGTEDLEAVAELLDAQQLVVRVGQVLPLGATRQAHEMLERLRPLPAGKIVLDALRDS